jgi:hypothetical protein
MFPSTDPIPLPAPVWLLKALHITTLSLHFIAVEILLGGLLIATVISLLGKSQESRTGAAALARRLPVVMTYVINLGVPPLLFAQVLYGRALYTSSVLLGAYWIAVIFLLMACYWLLYRFSAGLEAGRRVWWMGLLAWLLAGSIAKIYTSNMTLMLRPEVWQAMYSSSAAGVHFPTGDPTLFPRWLFMMSGGLVMGALWMLYLSGRSTFLKPEAAFLARAGGWIAVAGAALQAGAAMAVVGAQPEAVRAGLASGALYSFSATGWLAVTALVVVLGLLAGLRGSIPGWASWGSAVIALLSAATMTIYRDGIRDLTLLSKGLDVWARTVVTNWGVVILFLVLFVAGLGGAGWLISVVVRSRKTMEGVA